MNFFFLFFFFTDNLDFLNVNISDELLDLLICLSAYVVLLNESVIFIFDFLISIIFVHHLSDPDYLCFCPFPALPVQSLFPFLYFMVCRIWRRFWFNFTIVVCGDDILCYFFYWFSDFFFSAYIDKGLECCQKSGRYWFLCWICGWVVYIYIYLYIATNTFYCLNIRSIYYHFLSYSVWFCQWLYWIKVLHLWLGGCLQRYFGVWWLTDMDESWL